MDMFTQILDLFTVRDVCNVAAVAFIGCMISEFVEQQVRQKTE